MKVVFIGADPQVAEMVGLSLRLRWPDAATLVATTNEDGLELVERASPDVVLFDANLPDISLTRAVQEMRSFSKVPLIVLSHNGDDREAFTALELGADDYVRLPCELTEMLSRVWALLRRVAVKTYHEGEKPVRSGQLFINPATYEVFLGSQQVMLTSTEFRLLYLLIKNRGSVVSHETLGRTLWGDEWDSYGLVKEYVQRLRQKMGDAGRDPLWIANVHGEGYRFIGPKPEFREPANPVVSSSH